MQTPADPGPRRECVRGVAQYRAVEVAHHRAVVKRNPGGGRRVKNGLVEDLAIKVRVDEGSAPRVVAQLVHDPFNDGSCVVGLERANGRHSLTVVRRCARVTG